MRKIKALGQHFLISRAVLNKIVTIISPQEDELIIEIGAGKGALTFLLAERCGKIIAIEKDQSLVHFLVEKKRANVDILEKDVLSIDFSTLLEDERAFFGKVKLVGNLPYSISSPILFKALEAKDLFSSCVFLLQKEVAERLTAGPASKKYAPLSILFQIHFDVCLHFIVAPGSFSPPPRVRSAVVSLKRRETSLFPLGSQGRFQAFLRSSFGQRRKTLLNNIKSLGLPFALVVESFRRLGLDPAIRAEQVPIEKFVRLFDFLTSSGQKN
jgi:16S rRNA (adenine1518-N6/adenine1519-N6)-dimethyltransferase